MQTVLQKNNTKQHQQQQNKHTNKQKKQIKNPEK